MRFDFTKLTRRRLLLAGTAIGSSLLGSDLAPAATAPAAARPARGLPRRGEFVVRGAYVLTMDPELGEIPNGDVHVKNGAIVAVGRALAAPGAQVIDGKAMICMPGLIEKIGRAS